MDSSIEVELPVSTQIDMDAGMGSMSDPSLVDRTLQVDIIPHKLGDISN